MKRFTMTAAASLAFMGLTVAPGWTSDPEAADAQAKVRAIGKVWNLDVNKQSRAIYTPLLAKAPTDGVKTHLDLKYGPDERHRLDVHEPVDKPDRPPVVVYIHGGGLTGGDKDSPGTPAEGLIYANVPTYFARNGMLGVKATYRLVPNVKFPGGGEDMAAIVSWLRANVEQYGGDPDAIFLIGHSAGGTHVGAYLYDQNVQPPEGPSIAGAVILSGSVGPDGMGPREKTALAYYGEDRSTWSSNVPLGLLETYEGKMVPTFIITAELDPVALEAPSIELLAKLCVRENGCPRFLQVQGHNHITTALHLNTGDESLGPDLVDFVRRTVAERSPSE